MIHTLPSPKTTKKALRVGRGRGTGSGSHTTGKGGKGQTARSGHKSPRPGFEGGQNPISRRLPKFKGFTRAFIKSGVRNSPVQLSELAELCKENKVEEVTIETLVTLGLIKPTFSKDINVKVLFDSEISTKLNLKGVPASKGAKLAIEKAGGSVE